MSKVQCPNCFEQIDVTIDARRNFQSRRCPNGKSSRLGIGAGLQHCYCKDAGKDVPPMRGHMIEFQCCRCGDVYKEKR